jgi:hypothetical protein
MAVFFMLSIYSMLNLSCNIGSGLLQHVLIVTLLMAWSF